MCQDVSKGLDEPAFPPQPTPTPRWRRRGVGRNHGGGCSWPESPGLGSLPGTVSGEPGDAVCRVPGAGKTAPTAPDFAPSSWEGGSLSCRILGPHHPNLLSGAQKGPPRWGDSIRNQHPRPSIRPVELGPWNGERAAAEEAAVCLSVHRVHLRGGLTAGIIWMSGSRSWTQQTKLPVGPIFLFFLSFSPFFFLLFFFLFP